MTALIGALGRASAASECTVMTAPDTGRPSAACTVMVTDAVGPEPGTAAGTPALTVGRQASRTAARRHPPGSRERPAGNAARGWQANPVFWRAEGLIPT